MSPTALTFLIIDDSYIDRLVSSMLVRHSFEHVQVVEAASGDQAIRWIQSQAPSLPENLVILLDIMMPVMSGFEFLEELERLPPSISFKNTTVFMLSSTLDEEDIKRAENHPMVNGLIGKPLSARALQKLVLSRDQFRA